jgi:hypothetical protein
MSDHHTSTERMSNVEGRLNRKAPSPIPTRIIRKRRGVLNTGIGRMASEMEATIEFHHSPMLPAQHMLTESLQNAVIRQPRHASDQLPFIFSNSTRTTLRRSYFHLMDQIRTSGGISVKLPDHHFKRNCCQDLFNATCLPFVEVWIQSDSRLIDQVMTGLQIQFCSGPELLKAAILQQLSDDPQDAGNAQQVCLTS